MRVIATGKVSKAAVSVRYLTQSTPANAWRRRGQASGIILWMSDKHMDVAIVKNAVGRVSALAGLVISLILAGCESAPKAGSMNQAVNDYNSQRYEQAFEQASAAQERGDTAGRADAAYIAGLSAYQMGRLDEAEMRFMTASKSSSPETAAKAKAMLGQIRLDQRRPRDAAVLFVDAAPNLTGEDARKCAYNAGVAYQQAGDLQSAKKWIAQSGGYSSTARSTSSAATKSTSVAKNSASGFTLQVGAFREKKRAQQAAEEAQRLADRDGLGKVRIISRRDERGSQMYLVQFGSFPTRDAAAARTKLGRLNYIVALSSVAS